MSTMKRGKNKVWGSGAMMLTEITKAMDMDKIKEINGRVLAMSKDHQCVNRDYELKEWQIRLMAEN